ncbi:MAG: PAS domain S-box protein, partial [Bacteroidota bacterium]|nr:PAS domain S-box protein [Bacteroidota bacterium]
DEANSSRYRIMWEELANGKVKKVERKFIAKNNNIIWMLETLYPVKNLDGDYFKILAGMIDITETKMLLEETQKNNEAMKAQEEEIRQSMEELQASNEELERKQKELHEKDNKIKILDLSPEGIVLVNKKNLIIESVNLPLINLTNYTENELKDSSISRIFKSFDINSITIGKKIRENAFRKDGSSFVSDLTINEINENDGVKYLFFLKDITKEVRNEEELIKTLQHVEIQKKELTNKTEELIAQDEELKQNMEEMMATQEEIASKNAEFTGLFDSINKAVSVIEYDFNGKILHVNKIICELSGYKIEELVGKHHSILFDNKNIGQSEEYIRFWDKMHNGEHYEGVMKRICKDGTPIIVNGICNPIFDKDGKLSKVMELSFEIDHKEKHVKNMKLNSKVALN